MLNALGAHRIHPVNTAYLGLFPLGIGSRKNGIRKSRNNNSEITKRSLFPKMIVTNSSSEAEFEAFSPTDFAAVSSEKVKAALSLLDKTGFCKARRSGEITKRSLITKKIVPRSSSEAEFERFSQQTRSRVKKLQLLFHHSKQPFFLQLRLALPRVWKNGWHTWTVIVRESC